MQPALRTRAALLWKLLSACAFGGTSVLGYALMRKNSAPLAPLQVTFFQLFGAVWVALFFLWFKKKGPQKIPSGVLIKEKPILILKLTARSLCFFFGMVLWQRSLFYFPLLYASAFKILSPLFSTLLGVFILRESFTFLRVAAFFAAGAGIWSMGSHGGELTFVGDKALLFLPLGSALCFAFSTLLGKDLTQYFSPFFLTEWLLGSSMFLFSLIIPFIWKPVVYNHIPLLIVMGILSFVAHLSLSFALEKEDVGYIMPLSFVRFAASSILAFFWLKEAFPPISGIVWMVLSIGMLAAETMHKHSRRR